LKVENEKLKLKLKNKDVELDNAQSSKSITENQVREIKSNKDIMHEDLMGKINELSNEVRKKANDAMRLERTCSDLEARLEEKNHELTRLRDSSKRKEEEVANLLEKQYQLNKLTSQQGRTESDLKSATDKLGALQTEVSSLREKAAGMPKLEAELSKYRKQIQEMF
jgi:peptidoglycan hydrolase CwlO-like protein